MTLVIAGFERRKDPWADAWEIPGMLNVKKEVPPKVITNGLFAVSDSLITLPGHQGPRPVLTGLQKIHSIPVILWEPYIVCRQFRNYSTEHSRTHCFVAFAGSTLTATHALDTISENFERLRITYDASGLPDNHPGYVVKRDNEYVHIRDTKKYIEWAEDMYLPSDFEGILTADYLADVVEYSINAAFDSGKRYRLDEKAFNAMKTDFVVGIQCPASKKYRLFTFRTAFRTNDEGLIEIFAQRQEIGEGEIAVLGLKAEFEERAQTAYQAAVAAGLSTGKALFDFINIAIDEVGKTDNVLIDRPAIHKHFENGNLKTASIRREAE